MISIFKSSLFKKILNVGLFQAISQVVNAVTGFLIIRALSKVDYAAYALFFSVLSIISLVSGIGIHIGMSVIGGRVWKNEKDLGLLINTLENLRMTMFKWLLIPFIAYTYWLFNQNQISVIFTTFVLIVIMIIVWLQIHANLKFDIAKLLSRTDILNKYDLIPAIIRLISVGLILFFIPDSLYFILLITLLSYIVQYVIINKQVAKLYIPTKEVNNEYLKETISLMKPDIVNILYFAFQGQIIIVLLSIFMNVTSISEVTALSRVMVIFAIINSTLQSVLQPAFAKEHNLDKLKSMFAKSSFIYLSLLAGMCLFTYFFPSAILWIIGEKYAHLKNELFVMVLGACFTQYVSFMYNFISSKGWVKYHWLYTPFTILNQIILILTLNLHSEIGIIWFSTLGNCGFFLINCISIYLGFSEKGAKPAYS